MNALADSTERREVAAVGDLRLLRLARSTPLAVWALVIVHAGLALAYAISIPVLHAPDEPAHVDLIATTGLSEHLRISPYDEDFSGDVDGAVSRVGVVRVDWRFAPLLPWQGLAADTPRDQRPSYPDLSPIDTINERNPASAHPPAYYLAIDGLDRALQVVGADAPATVGWDALVLRWRALSILLTLPLPWLAFWVARRLADDVAGLVATIAALAVPQLSHAAGAVNNDSLLFTASGFVVLATAWIVTDDRSWRPAVIGGLAAGIGMATKIFALAAPLWLLLAYMVAVTANHLDIPAAVRRLAGAAGATMVAGGWWPLHLLATTGTPAPREFRYPAPDNVDAGVLRWLGEVWDRMSTTLVGNFGIEQFPMPAFAVLATTLAILALVVAGLKASQRVQTAVLVLPAVTTLTMVLYAAWGGYHRTGTPTGLHGRYLATGLVGVAAVIGIVLSRSIGRWSLAVVSLSAVALQGLGLGITTTSYWEGDTIVANLRSMVAFSGWSGWLLAGIAAAVLVSLALISREVTRTFDSLR